MPVNFKVDTSLTLYELYEKRHHGHMVEETPHVGNLAISTLAMAQLGMDIKLVDLNIGSKDNLFYPHCKIVGGKKEIIADPNVMTTHNKVKGSRMSLSDFHLRPLREQSNVFTHSSWIKENQEEIEETIKLTLLYSQDSHRLWGRYVDVNGHVTQRHLNGTLGIDQVHKVSVSNNGAGWVVPNPLNILFDLVIGGQYFMEPTLYMLSGQSMYKYITQPYRSFGPMHRLISDLYDVVRNRRFNPGDLHKNLEVVLVPIPVTRHFVAPRKLKDQLDRKLAVFTRFAAADARCGRKFEARLLSQQLMLSLRNKRKKLFGDIAKPLDLVCADSETGIFYTQHDLSKDRDEIYIPTDVLDMPIQTMLNIVNKIARMRA